MLPETTVRGMSVRSDRAVTVGLLLSLLLASCGPATNPPKRSMREVGPQVVTLATPVVAVRGLGDSVPAATTCGCTSYVVQLGLALAQKQGERVGVVNQGSNGQTSARLLAQVEGQGTRADDDEVTVVTIGANDFPANQLSGPGCTADDQMACYQADLAIMGNNVRAILDALGGSQQHHGPVLVTGYWNVFLSGQVGASHGAAYVRDSAALTQQVNDVLKRVAQQSGDTFVDLREPFLKDGDDTPLLGSDGDHPSAAGHALITMLLLDQLRLRA
jgi:lysophospholipase L1-like esterase